MHIGIVTPAYNVAPWIGDAIGSVLAQTHRDWTLVVVDDGSTDATADIVAAVRDPRVRLIRQANAGVSAARNRGMAEIDADALLFLDADDWLAPDALHCLARTLDASPDAVAAAGAFMFAEAGSVRRPRGGDILERLLVRNLFANGGHLLLRGSAVREAGGFRPNLAFGEDWEYWIRIAVQGAIAAADETAPLLFVRQRSGGAYHRLAANPAAFAPCMNAIFANPALLARFGAGPLAAIRRHAEAENDWIVGRELIRHGRRTRGIAWLRRSFLAHPSARRAALLAATPMLGLLPPRLRGPFQPYRVSGHA